MFAPKLSKLFRDAIYSIFLRCGRPIRRSFVKEKYRLVARSDGIPKAMNRRNTIKNLMMASAGMAALPAWAREWTPQEIRLPALPAFLTETETAILSAVSDTFIPAGADGVGALDVEVDAFLVRLFADCYASDVQENLKRQFNQLEAAAKETYGSPFAACGLPQREGLLLSMAASDDPDRAGFIELVKRETIRGFLTSRKVLREYYDYVVAPGHYYGCVDISET